MTEASQDSTTGEVPARGDSPSTTLRPDTAWPLWRRVAFRFVAVYLLWQIAPWHWFDGLPGVSAVSGVIDRGATFAVERANASLFHVRDPLVMPNGSGDTSFSWAELWLALTVALLCCVVWSVGDRKRTSYHQLEYWLRTMVRYYVAMAALSYGIIKIFALQMTFPTLSQLATSLGDFLPMRLSWLFIGYSVPYQVFGGVMEMLAGLLLLWRRSVTAGLLLATGVFTNVVMLNFAYDVPVKLYSIHLLFACLFLLAHDAPRLMNVLLLNRAVPATSMWEPLVSTGRQRVARVGVKLLLTWFVLCVPLYRSGTRWQAARNAPPSRPFAAGVYNVTRFAMNGDTIPPMLTDSLRWRDVIIDNRMQGSVDTRDTVFWQRYRRGYFRYRADTAARTVAVWKTSTALDSTWLFSMRYEQPDSNHIRFWTRVRTDSLYVELERTARHFQLTERQFHWLSEYNR